MVELSAIGYQPGVSILYRLDARVKFLCIFLMGLAIMTSRSTALSIFSIILMGSLFWGVRLALRRIFYEMRYFGIFLFLIWMTRLILTPGSPWFAFAGLTLTKEGFFDGLLVCWRLMLVFFLGLLFVCTTRTTEIKSAIAWLCGRLPWISGRRLAVMIGLLVRFVPLIFQQIQETSAALRARGIENRKNPVYRIQKVALPIMRRTFIQTDHLVLAMEARCFNENRTDRMLSTTPRDWTALLAVALMSLPAIIW